MTSRTYIVQFGLKQPVGLLVMGVWMPRFVRVLVWLRVPLVRRPIRLMRMILIAVLHVRLVEVTGAD